jgi:23S rRNA (guanosine2251-2'-O)-methyltransferase
LAAQGVQEKGRLRDILRMAQSTGIPVERPLRPVLDRIAHGHQGVALEVSGYRYADAHDILEQAEQRGEAPFILILDALQDPQNLGTLLRTADAVGVHGVFLPLRRTAVVTPAVVNASSGASEHLRIAQANLAQIIERRKGDGLWVVGLEGGPQSQPLDQVRLDGPIALVVGNEGQGMRALVRKSCDILVRLPMRGEIESLNAAVAGSVGLYMVWQARGFR